MLGKFALDAPLVSFSRMIEKALNYDNWKLGLLIILAFKYDSTIKVNKYKSKHPFT